MLTRKHFAGLANALAASRPTHPCQVWTRTRDEIAEYLATTNPAFDRQRFYRATEGIT